MGNLYKRGDIYYGDYYDRAGIRRRESLRTKDVKVARARLRDLELSTTDRGAHETEELADAIDYFTDVSCAGKSPGTIGCYKQKGAHLNRLIGGELADKLTRETIERYIATRLTEGAHTHSVHKELVVLRGALKAARARDRFHGALEVVPEFDAGYTPRTTYLTPDQFLWLVPQLVPPVPPNAKPGTLARREARMHNRALYCLLIALASPRRGELEALDWQHVDLGRNVIAIPKGKTVGRPVKIHPVLRPWLEAMHAGSGPVVQPWTNIGRDLPAAVERANALAATVALLLGADPPAPIPHTTPNDLRRTFASWLVQAGVSLYVVSRLLGHKSTRMVEMVYGQLDEATLEAAIGRLPGCDAGVPHAVLRPGTAGTTGHTPSSPMIWNSVETAATSTEILVPRAGIEPATRGFSVLTDMLPKSVEPLRKLRIVR